MKTSINIRLRHKLTDRYYIEGKHFSGTESEATIIGRNTPSHLVIRYTYTAPGMDDNIEEVECVPAVPAMLATLTQDERNKIARA